MQQPEPTSQACGKHEAYNAGARPPMVLKRIHSAYRCAERSTMLEAGATHCTAMVVTEGSMSAVLGAAELTAQHQQEGGHKRDCGPVAANQHPDLPSSCPLHFKAPRHGLKTAARDGTGSRPTRGTGALASKESELRAVKSQRVAPCWASSYYWRKAGWSRHRCFVSLLQALIRTSETV